MMRLMHPHPPHPHLVSPLNTDHRNSIHHTPDLVSPLNTDRRNRYGLLPVIVLAFLGIALSLQGAVGECTGVHVCMHGVDRAHHTSPTFLSFFLPQAAPLPS